MRNYITRAGKIANTENRHQNAMSINSYIKSKCIKYEWALCAVCGFKGTIINKSNMVTKLEKCNMALRTNNR